MNTRKRVRGFSLLEVSFALAISAMAITWALWSKVNTMRQENARVQGDALVTLSNSVGTYMTNNYHNLVNGTAVVGFASIYVPTVPELIAAGLLTNNFSTSNFYGSSYAVKISKVPAACVAPNCDIESLVYLTGVVKDYRTKLIDGPTLGAAAARIGANGGFSDAATPATIKGVGNGWAAPNPMGVAGILAVRGGYGSSGWAQFLRRDGSLPMTGSLNMGANDINAAKTLNSESINNHTSIATQTLATTAAVSVGGTLTVAGNTATNGITNNGAISTATLATTGLATIGGALNVMGLSTLNTIINNGTLTNNGDVKSTGDISGARFVPLTIVAPGDLCIGLDGYQARTSAGSLASCVNGKWMTPDAAVKPVPCVAQAVSWGAGCGASIGPTASGDSTTIAYPSTPAGATGSASYFCSGGVQVLQPGSSCTLPPCSAQTLSWGGGCSATFPATTVGSSQTQGATVGTGTGTATCNAPGGNGGWGSPSGSCTPPSVGCGSTYMSWSQYQGPWNGNSSLAGTYSCYGYTGSAAHGQSVGISNSASNHTGYGSASCNNGSWSNNGGSCDGALIATQVTPITSGKASGYPSGTTIYNCYVNNVYRIPDQNGFLYYVGLANSGTKGAATDVCNNHLAPTLASERSQAVAVGNHISPNSESAYCGPSGGYAWDIYSQGPSCKQRGP